ncbi:hypothetical protein [Dysgonomonas sp. GY617]|uniref:hypothetical protein n=1 Tax=Dysgonomonas sp. GY617 TaxID=2780420 RepID=UPI001883760C|nr:hypothetical protein [Dysgonomonas sp. GY617]MBF0577724.1 hypothetical protein [Dysgonomonas sp. GY617]
MNEEIKALIEREVEKYIDQINRICPKDLHDIPALKADFSSGFQIALSLFRWRSFATDDLPKIGQIVTVRNKAKKKYNTQEIQSHSHIHVLAENYIEWMPIPN